MSKRVEYRQVTRGGRTFRQRFTVGREEEEKEPKRERVAPAPAKKSVAEAAADKAAGYRKQANKLRREHAKLDAQAEKLYAKDPTSKKLDKLEAKVDKKRVEADSAKAVAQKSAQELNSALTSQLNSASAPPADATGLPHNIKAVGSNYEHIVRVSIMREGKMHDRISSVVLPSPSPKAALSAALAFYGEGDGAKAAPASKIEADRFSKLHSGAPKMRAEQQGRKYVTAPKKVA